MLKIRNNQHYFYNILTDNLLKLSTVILKKNKELKNFEIKYFFLFIQLSNKKKIVLKFIFHFIFIQCIYLIYGYSYLSYCSGDEQNILRVEPGEVFHSDQGLFENERYLRERLVVLLREFRYTVLSQIYDYAHILIIYPENSVFGEIYGTNSVITATNHHGSVFAHMYENTNFVTYQDFQRRRYPFFNEVMRELHQIPRHSTQTVAIFVRPSINGVEVSRVQFQGFEDEQPILGQFNSMTDRRLIVHPLRGLISIPSNFQTR